MDEELSVDEFAASLLDSRPHPAPPPPNPNEPPEILVDRRARGPSPPRVLPTPRLRPEPVAQPAPQPQPEPSTAQYLARDDVPPREPQLDEPLAQDAPTGAQASTGAEPEPEQEPEAYYPIQVDGREVRVTLKDALESVRRSLSGPSPGSQTAAQQAYAAELAQARAQREQYAALINQVQQRLSAAELSPEQLYALRNEADPTAYLRAMADRQLLAEQRGNMRAEQEQIAYQQQIEQWQRREAIKEVERAKMLKAAPELADQAELTKIANYAKSVMGYTDAELNEALDHRMVLIARKAMLHDEAYAADQARQAQAQIKLDSAPTRQLPPPAGRSGFRNPRQNARDALQARFDQFGRPDDMAELLLQ